MRYGRLAGHTLAPSRRPRPTRYSCSVWRVLENTGALEQRHVDATERVGGGWVGGVAGGRRAGRARGWRSRSGSIGAMASESQMKRMPGPVCAAPQALPCRTNVCRSVNSTAVPVYDAFCSAPVRCGKTECLPGSRLLMASLTALETVRDSGPGYCLITSMPMDWSVAFCVEEGFLGAMRAMSLRFARRAVHTLFARTAGVNVSRVPQVPVWTCGGYLGIRCAEGIAFTHTPR